MRKKTKSLLRGLARFALLCSLIGSAAPARAQQADPGKPAPEAATKPVQVARISGADVTIATAHSAAGAERPITNGNIVTVHSGQAHLNLEGGGEIGVCGPAKFQLLQSGDAKTLALQFGRIHVHLSGSSPFVIYTPFFQATPTALAQGPRDATIGLETNGTFCAAAEQGGVQIQQQLTSESLTVPQPQEVFFAGGDTKPIRKLSGCTCVFKPSTPVKPPAAPAPNTPQASPAPNAPPAFQPAPPSSNNPATPENSSETAIETARATTSSTQDLPAPAKPAEARDIPLPALPAAAPELRVVMPALFFDAHSPGAPLDPAPTEMLLVREVRVLSAYVFTGHVAARKSLADPRPSSSAPVVQPQGEKTGFWARVKRIFGS